VPCFNRRSFLRITRARLALTIEELEDRTVPTLLGQQLFPADNPWNQKITNAPVAANSASIINSIISRYGDGRLHPDFGQDTRGSDPLYGIPFNIVHGNTTPRVHVVLDNTDESDMQDAPIPADAVLEGDLQNGPNPGVANRGDSHLIVWDEDNNVAYEFFLTSRPSENSDGQWHANQETVWDMKVNTFRTVGWTSADAAGLSILAGLARPDEGLPTSEGGQSVITHPLRVTLQNAVILDQFLYPASHIANPGNHDPSTQPPMGARLRLKASVDLSTLNPESRVLAQAMKDYGLIVADNGSNFFFTGASYSVDANNGFALTWNDNDIQDTQHGLKSLHYSDFEFVDLTPAVTGLTVASGPAGVSVTVTGQNFSGAAGHLQVLFGSTPATSVTVVDDSHVTVVAPAGSGTVDVRVQSGVSDPNNSSNINSPVFGYGTSAVSSVDRFTYTSSSGPTHFSLSAPAGSTGGSAFAVTVTALDASNHLAMGYVGMLHFSSSDGSAILPGDVTLSNGSGTFSVGLNQVGDQTLTVTDTVNGSLTGSTTVTVGPASGNHLTITPQTATATVGGTASPALAVQILDPSGSILTDDNTDQVTLSITSGFGSFAPGSVTTLTVSAGVATFTNLSFTAAGDYTLSASGSGGLSGGTVTIRVARAGPPPSWLLPVACDLTHSDEYYTGVITTAYQRYLGRGPDNTGLASWLVQMRHGLTDEHLEAGFIGSGEYIQSHGGAGTGWVQGMYQDLLGRTPAQAEVDHWLQVLGSDVSTVEVAYGFAASGEREGQRVSADYLQYLRRTPAQAEVAGWVSAFESGAKTNEDVIAGFVGSAEYFQGHSGNAADWFASASQALFGTAATQSSSLPSYLYAVSATLSHSDEYYIGVITAAYQRYLGRLPDDTGLQSWLTQMRHGLTDEHLEAGFIGSAEYIQSHGGAGAGWVLGMYQDLLGRTPAQAEVDHWLQVLGSGVSTVEVAYGFAASGEREGQRVTADYQQYLGRTPADSEVAGWVSAFESGSKTNEDVIAGFVGSAEYFNRHNSHLQEWWNQAVSALFGAAGF
jgi:hypothetical protein